MKKIYAGKALLYSVQRQMCQRQEKAFTSAKRIINVFEWILERNAFILATFKAQR